MNVVNLDRKQMHGAARVDARKVMDQLNHEAAKLNFWLRTEMNAPSQRAWFTENGASGGGELLKEGRVSANQLKALPCHWRWSDYGPYLDRISKIAAEADVSPIEFADRQSILLVNPGLGGRLQITSTMRTAVSVYVPKDKAPAHIHSANASRTILTEKGGYTNVEGERCECKRGDIIWTPNGTWHDHGNDSDSPVMWIDMLDWPLLEYLDAAWVDLDYPRASNSADIVQPATHSDGYSSRLYGTGGLKPAFVSHQRGWGHNPTPMIHFRGAEIRESLHNLRHEKGDAHEGIVMQFVNPVTGKPVYQTMNYQAQLLRPGEETLFKRETSNTFVIVMEGEGFTEVGDQHFNWVKNDLLVMPNFLWRRHVNTGRTDAVLYTVSDASLMKAIGQYRAQGKDSEGRVTQLVA
ncbi:MAG TPA: cupin domain-containing protein [Micropepsaceae bacterium]|nr:cupin domain-containing protein [Micropepsaceae bacterium]